MISQIAFVSIVLAASSNVMAQSPKDQAKEGSRLEELFIWKASEELRLPPDQELKFAETIREMNSRRKKASDAMDKAVANLEGAKTKAESEKLTVAYRTQLKEVHAVQLAELDQLKKVIGSEKLARYLVVKNNLTDKLKTLISAPQGTK